MQNFIEVVTDWLKKPYDPNCSALRWAFFILLLIVLSLIWANVIGYFGNAAKKVVEAV